MKHLFTMTTFAVLLACASIGLRADVVGRPETASSAAMFDAASGVLSGMVSSVEQTGEVSGNWYGRSVRLAVFTATVLVDRVYKGDPLSVSAEVTYQRPTGTSCSVSKCVNLVLGEYGLFFLTISPDGYRLLDGLYSPFEISRLNSTTHRPGITGLELDLEAGLRDPNENTLLDNIDLIGGLEHVNSVSPLMDLLASSRSETVRAAVYVALLRLQNYHQLEKSLLFAESPADPSQPNFGIKDQIYDLVTVIHDPATAAILITFSHSKSKRLREAVIHALREIGGAEAVPVLVGALDDPVQMIRYDAVLGLAAIVQDWKLAPSVDTFLADQSKYINAWKSWWLETGKATYDRVPQP